MLYERSIWSDTIVQYNTVCPSVFLIQGQFLTLSQSFVSDPKLLEAQECPHFFKWQSLFSSKLPASIYHSKMTFLVLRNLIKEPFYVFKLTVQIAVLKRDGHALVKFVNISIMHCKILQHACLKIHAQIDSDKK